MDVKWKQGVPEVGRGKKSKTEQEKAITREAGLPDISQPPSPPACFPYPYLDIMPDTDFSNQLSVLSRPGHVCSGPLALTLICFAGATAN